MVLRATDGPVKLADYVPAADQRVVLYDKSWAEFEAMVALKGERRNPRLTFLDGALELMSPSFDHDRISRMLATLVSNYCAARGIPVVPAGSWLLAQKRKRTGVEPDECFVFSDKPKRERRPHLVIEVVWTDGNLDKLEAYRRLGIPEVWFWEDDVITAHVLTSAGYRRRARSMHVPDLDLALLARLARSDTFNEALAGLQAALRT